jgi:hypothetical protein
MVENSIDIWYGDTQYVGRAGMPQRWYNLLGRIHNAAHVQSVQSILNGGKGSAVSIGPDKRRLSAPGDFNVELDIDTLLPGRNAVDLVVAFDDGSQSTRTIEIIQEKVSPVQPPVEINWASDGIPNCHAQVVDGKWEVNGRYISTREIGYDRLIAIGDTSWKNYEILVPVVVHALEPRGYSWPSVHTGVGVVMYWKGHSNWGKDECASGQPRFGPGPYGAIGWWTTWLDNGEHLNFFDVDFRPMNPCKRNLCLNVPYLFRVRVNTSPDGQSLFRMRVWEEDTPEPDRWDVTAKAPLNCLSSGSLLLGAHETAVSFGPVRVADSPDWDQSCAWSIALKAKEGLVEQGVSHARIQEPPPGG